MKCGITEAIKRFKGQLILSLSLPFMPHTPSSLRVSFSLSRRRFTCCSSPRLSILMGGEEEERGKLFCAGNPKTNFLPLCASFSLNTGARRLEHIYRGSGFCLCTFSFIILEISLSQGLTTFVCIFMKNPREPKVYLILL